MQKKRKLGLTETAELGMVKHPVIPALGKLRSEDCFKFKTSVLPSGELQLYVVRHPSKHKKRKRKKWRMF